MRRTVALAVLACAPAALTQDALTSRPRVQQAMEFIHAHHDADIHPCNYAKRYPLVFGGDRMMGAHRLPPGTSSRRTSPEVTAYSVLSRADHL